MTRKRVLIHGFYGQGNLGDEAILKTFIDEFTDLDVSVSVLTSRPEIVEKAYSIDAVNTKGRRNLLKRLWYIVRSDLFILGGGGLIKDFGSNSNSLFKWLHFINLAKKLGKKTATAAIGVENIRFEESKRAIAETFNKIDQITVRDVKAQELLRDIGVKKNIHVFTDPAVLLGKPTVRKIKDIKNVFISLRHWYDKGFFKENPELENNFHTELASFLDNLPEDYTLTFVPMRISKKDCDIDIAKKVVSKMKNEHNIHLIEKELMVDEFLAMLENCDILIGMRLHSVILATSMGIPTIALDYSPKVSGFMDNIELGSYCISLEKVNREILEKLYQNICDNYENMSSVIVDNIIKAQALAKKNIALLANL